MPWAFLIKRLVTFFFKNKKRVLNFFILGVNAFNIYGLNFLKKTFSINEWITLL